MRPACPGSSECCAARRCSRGRIGAASCAPAPTVEWTSSTRRSRAARIYRASTSNLETTGNPADDAVLDLEIETPPDGGAVVPAGTAAESIIVYTDGACTGNPGPMGIGVVILDRGQRREVSEYLGEGTNNIAELTAIQRALELIEPADRERPVLVHSDSAYAMGLLSKGWKPRRTSSWSRSSAGWRPASRACARQGRRPRGRAGERALRSAGQRRRDRASLIVTPRPTSARPASPRRPTWKRPATCRAPPRARRACEPAAGAGRAGARPAGRGCRPRSASMRSMPWSSRLKKRARARIAETSGRAAPAGASRSEVPIAGDAQPRGHRDRQLEQSAPRRAATARSRDGRYGRGRREQRARVGRAPRRCDGRSRARSRP